MKCLARTCPATNDTFGTPNIPNDFCSKEFNLNIVQPQNCVRRQFSKRKKMAKKVFDSCEISDSINTVTAGVKNFNGSEKIWNIVLSFPSLSGRPRTQTNFVSRIRGLSRLPALRKREYKIAPGRRSPWLFESDMKNGSHHDIGHKYSSLHTRYNLGMPRFSNLKFLPVDENQFKVHALSSCGTQAHHGQLHVSLRMHEEWQVEEFFEEFNRKMTLLLAGIGDQIWFFSLDSTVDQFSKFTTSTMNISQFYCILVPLMTNLKFLELKFKPFGMEECSIGICL